MIEIAGTSAKHKSTYTAGKQVVHIRLQMHCASMEDPLGAPRIAAPIVQFPEQRPNHQLPSSNTHNFYQ